MSLDNLLLELQQKYNCSEPLYLSNFFQVDGKKWFAYQINRFVSAGLPK